MRPEQLLTALPRALRLTTDPAECGPVTPAFGGVRFMEAGGRIGIGSDSNLRISLAEELRRLDHSQRLRDRSRAALATAAQSTGRRLFEAACTGGAQAAGLERNPRLVPGLDLRRHWRHRCRRPPPLRQDTG